MTARLLPCTIAIYVCNWGISIPIMVFLSWSNGGLFMCLSFTVALSTG